MKPDHTAGATASGSTSPLDDSKPELSRETNASQPEDQHGDPADASPQLSQTERAVRSRAYRQRLKNGHSPVRVEGMRSGKRPDSHKPSFTANQVREQLRKYDRTPFLDLMSAWLECSPTAEAVVAFADKWPDRYAASLVSLGKIAGFAERKELTVEGEINVHHLSDSQLEDKARQAALALGIPMPKMLEVDPSRAAIQDVEFAEVPDPAKS